MAKEVASLAVRIGADISGLQAGAKQASNVLAGIGGKARAGATNLAKYGAAATAAGIAVGAALVNNARQAIDAQAKMAQQLDTTSASLATLKRAGELSGVEMKTITTAARTLSVRMGEAQQGLASAKDAFDKLGVSAESLSKLPLDQRIRTINEAMIANVGASERAAVAADLFGTRAATAMKMLSSGTLDQARKETELFGLALSDVDAAKVEIANDALSTIGNAFSGIVQQFTVQLAPILKAIGDLFLSTAEDAGGMQKGVENAFSFIINGVAFVIDAVDGIKRVFRLVADGVIMSWSAMTAVITDKFADVLEVLNKGAQAVGVDLFAGPAEAVRKFSEEAQSVTDLAFENINETLNRPMAGEAFKQFVADAQVAGEAAAQAAVKAREGVSNVALIDDGRTDKEIADINKRLEAIRTANMTELELINEKFAAENEAIRAGLEARQITEEEAHQLSLGASQRFSDQKLAIDQRRADKELRIEQQKEAAKKAILSQAFGGLTALMNTESRKMFEIGKAAAISQAIVSTYTGMTKALELGWPLGPIAAAAIGLNGFAQVANIRKQSFGSGGGGGSAAASNTQQINANNAPVGQQQEVSRNITVRGVDPGQMFSGQQLIDIINEAQKDGGVLRVA